ncbi:MAG: hypothetical protein ACRDY7_12545 [Acidimicrobiia bacterium]
MHDVFELKPITARAVPEAIKKAEHYRLLNEPEQAESICRDVLEAEPGNQHVLTVLVLALTDQFGRDGSAAGLRQAQEAMAQLTDAYQLHYYGGLVLERRARAMLGRRTSRGSAYSYFRDAMERYEQAECIRPEGDDSAILRWNACVRAIEREKLEPPAPDEREQPLE